MSLEPPSRKSHARAILAVLSGLVVLLMSVIQVAHVHAAVHVDHRIQAESTPEPGCVVCHSARIGAGIAVGPAETAALVQAETEPILSVPVPDVVTIFDLSIRPPPIA